MTSVLAASVVMLSAVVARPACAFQTSFLTPRRASLPAAHRHVSLQRDVRFNPMSVSTNNYHRRTGQRLSLLKESRKDEAPLQSPGIFEPGGGPAVIFEEEDPTDVYAKAITRTLQWVAASAGFGLLIYATQGSTTAEEFFAGYLVEQSLSVDNLFVFLLLFDYFNVPLSAQDRVLNWGIYGAIVMRAIMIGLGAAAIHEFHGVLLVFAAILIYSAIKVLIPANDDDDENMEENSIVKFSRKLVDSTDYFDGDRFFTLVEGVKKATPLFICMIAVEISDVVFAVDSIPAVFGVTENPLVVFSSNIFAIMGLRSLYTVLSKAAQDLEYLEPAVAVVLGFIGTKMIAEYGGYIIPTPIALGVVATLLSGGIGLSVYKRENETEDETISSD